MVLLRKRNDSIAGIINQNNAIVIAYGMSMWTAQLIKDQTFTFDYVCDKHAMFKDENYPSRQVEGVPVVNIYELKNILSKQQRKCVVIICVGTNQMVVSSIIKDLFESGIEADVFDLFENSEFFNDDSFCFMGQEYKLFEHSYNCGYIGGRMTERGVELSVALDYISKRNAVTEIGAVTPYYFRSDNIIEIIDPTDSCAEVTKKSIFECDLTGRNILCISTVEHIGTADYGMHESYNAADAVEKIIDESRSCLITAPCGYNQVLDQWMTSHLTSEMIHVLKRSVNNKWVEVKEDANISEMAYTSLWANGLFVIIK